VIQRNVIYSNLQDQVLTLTSLMHNKSTLRVRYCHSLKRKRFGFFAVANHILGSVFTNTDYISELLVFRRP